MSTRHILILLFVLNIGQAAGQDQVVIDSLLARIKYNEKNTNKLSAYCELIEYYQKFNLQKSQQTLTKAVQLAQDEQVADSIYGRLLYLQTNNMYFVGNLDEALRQALKSYSFIRKINDPTIELKLLNTIGVIYDRLYNYKQSMNYYFMCLELIHKNIDSHPEFTDNKTVLYNNIACAYMGLDSVKQGKQYFQKGLEAAQLSKNEKGLANIYNNLGKFGSWYDSKEVVRSNLNKAIAIRERLNDSYGLAKSYYHLAFFFYENDIQDSSRWAAQKSIDIARNVGALVSQQSGYSLLYMSYEKDRDYKNALAAHVLYKSISDSVLNVQKMNEILSERISFEAEELQQQMLIEKQQYQIKYAIAIGGLVIGLLLIISLYIILKFKKNKIAQHNQQLEVDLESKNKELTTNVMYLVRKNELINAIARKLLKLKANLKAENQKPIHEIIIDLQSEVDKEVWQDFEYRFQQVHNGFYKNLLKAYPDISPAEERLCAFLRLNLSTKEIAAITHLGIKSIEVARARLRKKFNINGTDTNLVSYLEKF